MTRPAVVTRLRNQARPPELAYPCGISSFTEHHELRLDWQAGLYPALQVAFEECRIAIA
jgi:hypothetical protein